MLPGPQQGQSPHTATSWSFFSLDVGVQLALQLSEGPPNESPMRQPPALSKTGYDGDKYGRCDAMPWPVVSDDAKSDSPGRKAKDKTPKPFVHLRMPMDDAGVPTPVTQRAFVFAPTFK
jgi:hypothetical protein